jgi:hypothetical protein
MKTSAYPSFKPSFPLLMAATQDSTAQEAVQLVTAIRRVGVSALGAPQVRDDAAFVRGQYCDVLVPSAATHTSTRGVPRQGCTMTGVSSRKREVA